MYNMKREDKIKKLNELGIYEKWYNNVVNDIEPFDPDELLDSDDSWLPFICGSFYWNEETDFWSKISRK